MDTTFDALAFADTLTRDERERVLAIIEANDDVALARRELNDAIRTYNDALDELGSIASSLADDLAHIERIGPYFDVDDASGSVELDAITDDYEWERNFTSLVADVTNAGNDVETAQTHYNDTSREAFEYAVRSIEASRKIGQRFESYIATLRAAFDNVYDASNLDTVRDAEQFLYDMRVMLVDNFGLSVDD